MTNLQSVLDRVLLHPEGEFVDRFETYLDGVTDKILAGETYPVFQLNSGVDQIALQNFTEYVVWVIELGRSRGVGEKVDLRKVRRNLSRTICYYIASPKKDNMQMVGDFLSSFYLKALMPKRPSIYRQIDHSRRGFIGVF